MCLIALKTAGAHLNENEIRHDFSHNPDGAGFMYVKNGRVHWEKGFFNVQELINRWNEVVDDSMVAALHTRIATHGAHNSSLCHPFPLDGSNLFKEKGDANLVLMHNGVIPKMEWFESYEDGDSDTSAYCRRITPILKGNLPDNKLSKMLEDQGGGSRFLILNGNGEFVTIGRWYECDGVKYSNSGYLGNREINNLPSTFLDLLRTDSKDEKDNEYYSEDNLIFDDDIVEMYDTADAFGLVPVDNESEEGRLEGAWSEDEQYFVCFSELNPNYYNRISTYTWDYENREFTMCKNVNFVL